MVMRPMGRVTISFCEKELQNFLMSGIITTFAG